MDRLFLDDKWSGDKEYDARLEEMFMDSLIIFNQYGIYDIDFKIDEDVFFGSTCCDGEVIILITMSSKRYECKIEDKYGEIYDDLFEEFADKWSEYIWRKATFIFSLEY